jgi:hypothetical protein
VREDRGGGAQLTVEENAAHAGGQNGSLAGAGTRHGRGAGTTMGAHARSLQPRLGYQWAAAAGPDAGCVAPLVLTRLSERCGCDALQQRPRGDEHVPSGIGAGTPTRHEATAQALVVHVAGAADDVLPRSCRHAAQQEHRSGAALQTAAAMSPAGGSNVVSFNQWTWGSVKKLAAGVTSSGGWCHASGGNCTDRVSCQKRGRTWVGNLGKEGAVADRWGRQAQVAGKRAGESGGAGPAH